MNDSWRYFFYYTFGLLPSVFFGLRFLIQWIASEKKRESYVGKLFWRLSFFGNLLLSIHYFIQMQYLLLLIQTTNGYIAWRNLNLLNKKQTIPFKYSILILLVVILVTTAFFFFQVTLFSIPFRILEIPAGLLNNSPNAVSALWHLFGGVGCLLFASRFWIQWWVAERSGESKLGKSFWYISIVGSLSALVYFVHINDWVSSLNYLFGLIPYIRNLMLTRKAVLN